MRSKRQLLIGVVALGMALGSVACGDKRDEAPAEPVQSAEEARQEAEAKARREAAAALTGRANELVAAARALQAPAGSEEVLPAALEASLGELAAEAGKAESLLSGLDPAAADGWEAARQRLEAALTELESARARASAAVADWQTREAEALAAAGQGESPVDPATGLIQGLDGGQYQQYLVSVVEQVQRRLRSEGIYAGPVDGRFDVVTMQAVGRYQEEHGLQVSGVPSPLTRGKLFDDGA